MSETMTTDVELMQQVAAHPLVVKYRQDFQAFHNRMESAYGAAFLSFAEYPEQRGFKCMTERESRDYNNLYLRMNAVRKMVREHLSTTA
jgi:hypothetical protein